MNFLSTQHPSAVLRLPMLGGKKFMVAGPAAQFPQDAELRQSIEEALAHASQALRALDAHGLRPDLGARLQEVIDELDEERRKLTS